MMKTRWIWLLTAVLLLALAGCTGRDAAYEETFDQQGSWPQEDNPYARGRVFEGAYELEVKANDGLFWATNGRETGDGSYQVEATQVAGTLDNGYGLLFMVDPAQADFYLFKVSGDGYVQLARCRSSCETEFELLGSTRWEESAAVLQGLNQTNVLRVTAENGNLTFTVNGQEVGRAADVTFTRGEAGVVVETLGEAGVKVRFDNLRFTPAGN
jgi:hypothetical protein